MSAPLPITTELLLRILIGCASTNECERLMQAEEVSYRKFSKNHSSYTIFSEELKDAAKPVAALALARRIDSRSRPTCSRLRMG